jgi:hypothetical protein
MTAVTSLSRRVFLSSIRHRTHRTFPRSSMLAPVRLNASAAAMQPSHVFPPSPPVQSSPNHQQRHERSHVSVGSPSIRAQERRRRRWQGPSESECTIFASALWSTIAVPASCRCTHSNCCVACGDQALTCFIVNPNSRYQELIENGTLRRDEYQQTVVDKLQALHMELRDYEQPPVPDLVDNVPNFVSCFICFARGPCLTPSVATHHRH